MSGFINQKSSLGNDVSPIGEHKIRNGDFCSSIKQKNVIFTKPLPKGIEDACRRQANEALEHRGTM